MLSNRVLALQQQQQQQPSHFPPSHYPASYYPNYMPQAPIPIPHPTPAGPSHHSSVQFPVHQPSVPMRLPNTTTTVPNVNSSFFSPNAVHQPPPPQQQQPPPPPQQQQPPASSSSNPSLFQFSTSTAQSSSSSQTTATTPTKPIFSMAPPKSNPIESTNKPAPPTSTASSISFPTMTTNTTNGKPSNSSKIFEIVSDFPHQPYSGPFVFGTGNTSSIFGVGNLISGLPTISPAKQEPNHDENGEDDDEGDSYEPDSSSFKPIITLSAVESKTGEEDENVLFCERGKLYRFDASSNQMKERGIGDMKILQHKTTNICRIVMRREQVLKICANHQITAHMELKPHQGSANAFIWSAMDFADGEAKHETLCIRFKTEEQAKNFAKIFNEAKEINSKKSGGASSVGKASSSEDTKSKSTANDDGKLSFLSSLFLFIINH